jgi:alkanesulfonate monooxygenase SsuD/methylene tetrahydromethanopterin reductase-like flavin-dependent oxidoreductase (luciferase family)
MPGLVPVVGATEEEAKAKLAYLQSLLHPDVALAFLSFKMGMDVRGLPLDKPLPPEFVRAPDGKSPIQLLDPNKMRTMPLLQLAVDSANSLAGRMVVGSPDQIVDFMQEWFENGACDGFNVQPPYMPGLLDDFVDLVIPELRRRKLFRTRYEGKTLREHLGLPRPASRHQQERT